MNQNIFIIILACLFITCTKEKEVFVPYEEDNGRYHSLLSKIDDRTESFVFDNAMGAILVTQGETVISIPAQSFLKQNNSPYTGDVKLKFNKYLTSEYLAIKELNTLVDNQQFIADVVINMEAFSVNGERLQFIPNKKMTLYIPYDESVSLEQPLYFASVLNDGLSRWEEQEDIDFFRIKYSNWDIETIGGKIFGRGYEYNTNIMGWQAVGQYLDGDSKESEVCIKLPQLFNRDNSIIFFMQKNKISIVNLQSFETSSNSFCGIVRMDEEISNYQVLTLSATENDEYYLGQSSIKISGNNQLSITPQKISLKELSDFLRER